MLNDLNDDTNEEPPVDETDDGPQPSVIKHEEPPETPQKAPPPSGRA